MTNRFTYKTIVLIAAVLIGLGSTVQAQFINLHLKVEPELSASVEQPLDFGTQLANAGQTQIGLGDVNMGVFSIRAFHTQNIYLNLSYPDALVHANPAIDASIPLSLSAAYNNSGQNNINRATPLPASGDYIPIYSPPGNSPTNDEIWKELFVYIYGSIEIGEIPNGEYTGDIVLTLEYD